MVRDKVPLGHALFWPKADMRERREVDASFGRYRWLGNLEKVYPDTAVDNDHPPLALYGCELRLNIASRLLAFQALQHIRSPTMTSSMPRIARSPRTWGGVAAATSPLRNCIAGWRCDCRCGRSQFPFFTSARDHSPQDNRSLDRDLMHRKPRVATPQR
jgi:hypothetical protein